ncbi:Uncharacterised protein [uncultured Clostridium sp.]|nr:Uncharacterised protein [uncultured Clostridium sp.]
MTVKELRDKLCKFEDNLPVYIVKARKPEPSKKDYVNGISGVETEVVISYKMDDEYQKAVILLDNGEVGEIA